MTTTSQVRFTKTPEIQKMLNILLKKQYRGLSEADIFKLSFSQFYNSQVDENGFTLDEQRELDKSIAEVRSGEVEGPYDSIEEFVASLKK